MSKILFVRPPDRIVTAYLEPEIGLPIGLLSMAAVLRDHGHEVRIFDARVERPVHDALWASSSGERYFGADWRALERVIEQSNPEIIGISNQFSIQLDNALMAATVAKTVAPNAITIVGGNHATGCPSDVLSETAVDFAAVGEGEATIAAVAAAKDWGQDIAQIPGLAYRSEGRLIQNPRQDLIKDLDALPIPSYDLIDLERYFAFNRRGYSPRTHVDYPQSDRAVSVITSRGCPYGCIFCSIRLTAGRLWRAHSAGYVLDHIEHLVRRYGVRHVHFEDDNLGLRADRFREICDGLVDRGLGITWDAPNGVRADLMSDDLLATARRSGCTHLFFACESGVQRVLDHVVKKSLKVEAVEKVAASCSKIGIDLGVFFIIGLPGETKQEMCQIIDFALYLEEKYGVLPVLHVARLS